MKNLTIITLIFFSLVFSLSAQTRKNKPSKNSTLKSKSVQKVDRTKIVSCGICNNKAINLVKPEYPQAAKAVNVKGSVNVLVLIDEQGNVIEAKAISGHLFLRASSVKAALESKFEPLKLSGKPVKVSGVIVYNFTSDNYNWLEIGNNFGKDKFIEMLPIEFAEEKKIYEQYKKSDYETSVAILENLKIVIEGKLASQPKKLWLFQVGMWLNEVEVNQTQNELKEKAIKLKNLLANFPQNISFILISRSEKIVYLLENRKLNTYNQINGSKLYQELKELKERLSVIGN
jgi:TonB family protein